MVGRGVRLRDDEASYFHALPTSYKSGNVVLTSVCLWQATLRRGAVLDRMATSVTF